MEAHLFNPDGGLVAVLPAQPSPEDIFRAAYNLGEKDVVVSTLGDREWVLTILAFDEKPQGDLLRTTPFTLREGTVKPPHITPRLLEMALLDLWDRGWSIKECD